MYALEALLLVFEVFDILFCSAQPNYQDLISSISRFTYLSKLNVVRFDAEKQIGHRNHNEIFVTESRFSEFYSRLSGCVCASGLWIAWISSR